MNTFSILLISIGLSMDSFAVSIANGLCINNLSFKKIFVISFSLAFFQALMPLLGWFLGKGVDQYIDKLDHWVAFILLGFIGGKMIYEGLQQNEEQCSCKSLKPFTLFCQSIATSIDALAVGISFAVLNHEIVRPVIIIGGVTFVFAYLGLKLGKYLGEKFEQYIEIFGGIVLVGIGIKILIEHTLCS